MSSDGSTPSAGPPSQQQQGSAASRLQLQRQRLAEQRNRLLAGQGGSGAGDARGLPLPPKPVVRESTGAAPIPAPPRSSTSAAGERTVARAPPPPPQAPSNTLPSPPLLSAVNAGTVARAVPQGRALPAPSNSQSSAPVGHGMASGPPVPPPIAFRPQMQGPGAPLRPPAGGRPAALPTLRAGSPAPVPVNRMGLLRGSHSLPPAAEEDSSAQVSERDLSSAQSLPFVAPPAFGSAGLDDDSSFFSDYGEGQPQQQQQQQQAAQEAGTVAGQADVAPASSGESVSVPPAGDPAVPVRQDLQAPPVLAEEQMHSGEGGQGEAPAAGGKDAVSSWQSQLGYSELVQPSYQASVQESYDSAAAWQVETLPSAAASFPDPTYAAAISQGQPQRDPTAAYGSTWTAAGGEEVGYSNGSGGAGHYPTTATWTDAAAGYGYGSLADGQYGQAGYEVANYSQAGYEAATYAQAGYGATPSQEQMGYVPLGYDLAAPASQSWQATPQTAEEAMRIPHGRPPIALISFNIGGRLALFLPQTSGYGPGGAGVTRNGPIQLTRLAGLHRLLQHHVADAALLPEGSRDRSAEVLRDFPGPLLPSSNRAKVAGFIRERELKVNEEEEGARSPDMLAALWGLLRLMALNEGRLRSSPSSASKTKPSPPLEYKWAAEAGGDKCKQLRLTERLGPGGGAALSGLACAEAQVAEVLGVADPTNAVSAPPEPWIGDAAGPGLPTAAGAVQALLLQGNRDEALRAATAAGLWGPALVLAYQQGPAAFAEAAGAMLSRCLLEGSPLHTSLSVMAGASDRLFPPPGSGVEGAGGLEASYVSGFGGEGGLGQWRSQLTVLAANPCPGDEPLLVRLGDRLWSEAGEGAAAHVCYLLAGLRPEAFSGEARLCAVGWDHHFCRRGWTNPAPLLRTQVLEWALPTPPGAGAGSPAGLAGLPYKVLYAVQLAEHGHVERAMQYCKVVLDSIAALGRPPAGLLVCRAAALDLQDRLQQHALGHNIRVNQAAGGGTLISSVGRWIDLGINKLIGGDLVGPPSTGSEPDSHSPAPPPHPQVGSRGGSTVGSEPSPEQARYQPGSAAGANSSDGSLPAEPAFGSASNDTGGTGERSTGRGSSISLSGMLGRVGGLLTSIPSSAPKKESQIGEANTFYYDEETKQWRERGVEPPPLPEAPPPPPTSFHVAPSPPPSGAILQPPGFEAGSGAPAHGPLKRTGTHSRYVDTMASPQGQPTVLPEGVFGLRANSISRDSESSAPSFFVPTASYSQQGASTTTQSQSQPMWNSGH